MSDVNTRDGAIRFIYGTVVRSLVDDGRDMSTVLGPVLAAELTSVAIDGATAAFEYLGVTSEDLDRVARQIELENSNR